MSIDLNAIKGGTAETVAAERLLLKAMARFVLGLSAPDFEEKRLQLLGDLMLYTTLYAAASPIDVFELDAYCDAQMDEMEKASKSSSDNNLEA
jgi:hypothetical protein